MKKILLLLLLMSLFLLALVGCGGSGGGAGSASMPAGESPGTPAIVQLNPVNFVAQIGASILLKAKILDSNGMPVQNVPVTFIDISSTGSLTSANVSIASLFSKASTVAANTDSSGIATARLDSSVPGFVTVQAQIGSGISIIRDKRTVYFSSFSLSPPIPAVPVPSMVLDVTPNTTLFENNNVNDNQVVIRATVYTSSGSPAPGVTVKFGSDSPNEVSFPTGNTPQTDSDGRAFVLVQVDPIILTSLTTVVNITASASNGAAGMVSLTLNPVTISSISMTAAPTITEVDKTSNIIAALKTSLGTPVPDGTTVSFTASCPPLISMAQMNPPFAQTTSGSASSTLQAPSTAANCQVFGASGGISASVFVSVIPVPVTPSPVTPAALTIVPGSVGIVSSGSIQTINFSISGGTGSYTTTSSDPSKAFNAAPAAGDPNSVWRGTPLTVSIPANAAAGPVTLNVFDSVGDTTSATITIIAGSGSGSGGAALSVSPSSITLSGLSTTADQVTFTITGGTPGYVMFSNNTAVIPSVAVSGNTFTINPNPVASSTQVTLTVMDSLGVTKTVTVTVTPASASLAINPSAIDMAAGSSTTFFIIGGIGPFNVVSGDATKATVSGGVPIACTVITAGSSLNCPVGTTQFTVSALSAGSSIITVVDTGDGTSKQVTVTVH